MMRAWVGIGSVLLLSVPATVAACDLDGGMGHRFMSLQSQYNSSANYAANDAGSADPAASSTSARDYYAAVDAAEAARVAAAQAANAETSGPQRDYR